MIHVLRYLRTRTGFLLILLLFGCIAVSPLSLAQSGSPPPLATDNGEPEGPTIGEVIASIAEKPSREPTDFEQLAQMTLQIGQTALQQGQRIPDPSIWDGIHAVDAGEAIAPMRADWNNLRAELEKLLEEPPQQEDQNQQDNQEQQQDQNSDEQESENNEQSDSNNPDSEQGDNQESSDQQNSEEDGRQQNSQQEQQEQNGSEQQQQNGNENGQQSQQQERIGDMDDSAESPELDQERSQQAEQETREVGGEPSEQTPRSAKQAMTLQQLEQLQQQDKPGALHMLLQNAERSDKPTDRKPQKDW